MYFMIFQHLKAPAQRKRCGYKEGQCNRCNRMQRPALASLCMLQQRCLLSRLSIPFEFHSLFPFSSAFPSFLSLCKQTASNGQQRGFLFVSLVSGFQRAFTQQEKQQQRHSRHKSQSIERDTSARSISPSHTHTRYILQA